MTPIRPATVSTDHEQAPTETAVYSSEGGSDGGFSASGSRESDKGWSVNWRVCADYAPTAAS